MALTAFRENLYYIGFAKQSGWNTPVTPTKFWRWLGGSDANPKTKMQKEREGDTTPFITLVYKKDQYWEIKIKHYIRPQMAGYGLQGLLGTGSDTYTAPTKSTTLSAAITAGATSFSSVASLGNTGTGYVNFTPGYSSTTYEVQNVNLASQTGTGPYTYNLVSGGSFKNAHSSSDAITTVSTHVLTRQPTTYDPYTIEVAFNTASTGKAFRIQDCVCTQVKITSETGKPVIYEETWFGSLATIQAALLTPTFEGTSVIGNAGSPFMHYQASGNWSVDGSTTGNAATVKKFELTLKNSTAYDEMIAEALNPTYFTLDNFDIDLTLTAIFQAYNQYLNMYFGSGTAPATTVDSYLVGTGAFSTDWATDGINELLLSLPYLNYTAGVLTPKLDGKPLTQSIAASGSANATNLTPLTATVYNSLASQY